MAATKTNPFYLLVKILALEGIDRVEQDRKGDTNTLTPTDAAMLQGARALLEELLSS